MSIGCRTMRELFFKTFFGFVFALVSLHSGLVKQTDRH